ncbi:hypothetical protein NXS98_00435 [Fontisphaera persica]|uniref:hypothetical protein n=1 Tax=Fontisphaera persica TaxID=2974023 RepID=UPI0024C01808|nr:hypothetical protein [Fontisphaera persica]WCJ59618.1 hypothetical protein NXS98_00435 [Fontisphaera persica]
MLALVALVLFMFYFSDTAGDWRESLPSQRWHFGLLFGGLLFMGLLDCWALGWVGLWQGLCSRRQLNGGLHAIILILGVPWTLASFLYLALLWIAYLHQQPLPRVELLYSLLFFFSLPASIVLGLHGRQQVRQNFRTLALQHRHGEAPLPWWMDLFSLLQKLPSHPPKLHILHPLSVCNLGGGASRQQPKLPPKGNHRRVLPLSITVSECPRHDAPARSPKTTRPLPPAPGR